MTNDQRPGPGGGGLLEGRYQLLQKIGEGGAAEVFRARDVRLDRMVAIKLLRRQYTHDEESRTRFINEAKAAASLSHPHIVDIYDFGELADGTMFIAMQYIEGQNLKDILRQRGRLSPSEAITIARQACQALSLAHSRGLIHRDVKPQNIMVDRQGNAHLTDFGIAKALSGPQLTQSGMTFGTAAYLSPEQATGEAVGPASDIYSLGCVMYEMLSGRPPFTGDNPAIVAYKQVWEHPAPLHDLAPEVPPSLESVVMRCLNKDPGRRYPSAEALAAELDNLSRGFNQPTQAMSLGVAAAAARDGQWTPVKEQAAAERSLPVPMAPVAAGPPISPSMRPTQVMPQGVGVPVPRVPATAQQQQQWGPPPVYSPPPTYYTAPTVAGAAAGGGVGAARLPVVNTDRDRGNRWVPFALAAILLLALAGLLVWLGGRYLGLGGGPDGTPTATVPAVVSAPTATDTVVAALPTPTALHPKPTAVPSDTPTPVVPTETATPPPPPPTDTPAPPPPPTDTPEPAPPPPTDTPAAPPPEPTITLPTIIVPSPGAVTIQPQDFSGGYHRSDWLYHGATAIWVYGQGTQYSTMTANFSLNGAPHGPSTLSVVGLDSEDAPKTPISISVNGQEIYNGPNPLPNDFASGLNGQGNWGQASWRIPPNLLVDGGNTLTITDLSPSDKINQPPFFMLHQAIIAP